VEQGSDRLIVRPATLDDFDTWFELYDAVAAEGTWIAGESPSDREARWAAFERHHAEQLSATFLAEVDGSLVGELGVGFTRPGVAELGMAVRSGWRGQGIGSALMTACIEWVKAHKAYKVSLSVWPHNAAARALYAKFGFEEEGRLRRHYRRRNGELWDAIVMGLILDRDSPGCPYLD